jgi:hypothetical protein
MIPFIAKINAPTACRKSAKSIINFAKRSKSGYEVITGACIPYYDFDYAYDSEKLRSENESNDRNKSIDAVKKVFPDGVLYKFESNGENKNKKFKNSFHILVRGCGYASCGKALPVVEYSDPAVYKNVDKRQLFRLPYLSKEGENRPLVMARAIDTIEPEEYIHWCVSNIGDEKLVWDVVESNEPSITTNDDQYVNKIAEMFPDVVLNKQHYRTTEKDDALFINYRDIVKEQCPLCKRTHEDNQFYGYLSANKKLFYKCKKSDQSVFVHDYDPDNNSKGQNNTEGQNADMDVNARLDKYSPIKFDSRFCADYEPFMQSFDHEGVVAIASGTGTGKTYASAEAVKARPNAKTGVLSFRISLAAKYEDDFTGFTSYLNEKIGSSITADRWICQIDSLHRVKNRPDILIIDEINQVRRHLYAETFLRNNKYLASRAKFNDLIKNTRTVVIMDANISPVDLNWLAKLRPDMNLKLFLNTNVANSKRHLLVKNEHRLIAMAKQDLLNGNKIAIAHNGGKKHHEPLKRALQTAGKRIIVINSETKELPEVKSILSNPNTEFGKYDCIIYSPSVQSGVSYDVKGVFRRIYGIFSNCTNSSGDACQMLDRIRHPMEAGCVLSIKEYNSSIIRSMEVMKNNIVANRLHLSEANSQNIQNGGVYGLYNSYDELELIQNQLLDERCSAELEQNMDRVSFKRNFIAQQKIYGNAVHTEVLSKVEEKKTTVRDQESKLALSKLHADVKTEKAEELNDAPNLTMAQVDTLRNKLKDQEQVIQAELTALKKFNLNHLYKMDEPVDDPKWYETYDDKKLKDQYLRTSRYFTEDADVDLSAALEKLKTKEVRRDAFIRAGNEINGEKSIDECVVDSLLHKPVYQQEKILINWIKDLGYDSLNSAIEVDEDIMKLNMVKCITKMNEHTFNVLGKHHSKLKTIQKLKADDKNYMKTALSFINGSLKAYFGITITRKVSNRKLYIIVNKNIVQQLFQIPQKNIENIQKKIPVLGKRDNGHVDDDDDDEDTNEDSDEVWDTAEDMLARLLCPPQSE